VVLKAAAKQSEMNLSHPHAPRALMLSVALVIYTQMATDKARVGQVPVRDMERLARLWTDGDYPFVPGWLFSREQTQTAWQ
jgi:hypothetical protein